MLVLKYKKFKRICDFLFAVLLLFVSLPLLLLVSLSIYFCLGKPVFWFQLRPGIYGRPFKMFKFRTMLDVRNSKGDLLSDRHRMTALGSFLRNSSVDELPALVNILRGEMSFVGPRPLLMEYMPLYSAEQARRHDVLPGLSGWAQVNGRNTISWCKKFRMDVWYVQNHGLMLDLYILLLTVWRVIRRDGISAQGEVTMSRFTGSDSRL